MKTEKIVLFICVTKQIELNCTAHICVAAHVVIPIFFNANAHSICRCLYTAVAAVFHCFVLFLPFIEFLGFFFRL